MKKGIAFITAMLVIISALSVVSYAEYTQTPKVVNTVYETDDIVIADIVVTEFPYNADNTGINDCTAVIQRAVDDCASNGGGTVFLPVGKYRITDNIKIKQFVTLTGDWQDPDEGNNYGTVIIADVKSEDVISPGLITVGASAGAVGLTVWYPNQSLDDVKPYPFTFYVTGNEDYMLSTVKNCTLINSYRGIGVSAECENGVYQCHEMFTAENVKGTCLYQGLSSYNSADVDTYKTLYFLNKYWAQSGDEFNAPEIDKLNAYTRANRTGLVLGDLEFAEFADIKVSDSKYGVNVRKGMRYAFGGVFFDINITDCDYGFYAEKSAVAVSGKQWGASFYGGKIEGTNFAIYNPYKSYLSFTNVEINGKTRARNIKKYNTTVGTAEIDYNSKHIKPSENLFIAKLDKTGKTDISNDLQSVLDSAKTVGGVVYIPAGLYRMDNPVSVPDNVELRGSSSVASRCQSGNSAGTLILSFYGYGEDDKPLIALGENSGVSGIRIDYPLNNPTDDSGNYMKTSPAVYSNSDGAYVVNCCITLASTGVRFENSNNAFIKKLVGCCQENMIDLSSCKNVNIEGCLQNATCLSRNGYGNFDIPELKNRITEENLFKYYFDPISRKNAEYIKVSESVNVIILNCFIYGGKSFFAGNNSSVTIINSGCDGTSKDGYIYNLNGGDTTVLNSMRFNQNSGRISRLCKYSDNSEVKIFNSQAMGIDFHEYPVIKNVNGESLSRQDKLFCILRPVFEFIHKIASVFNR